MPSSTKVSDQRRRRAQLKAQGLVYMRGWVTAAQAQAIRGIMANVSVTYEPNHRTPVTEEPAAEPDSNRPARREPAPDQHKSLKLKRKSPHLEAWTVWLGDDELGTVYRHRVDEGEQSISVWVAYRPRGHNTRHETRDHAIEALLQEYTAI